MEKENKMKFVKIRLREIRKGAIYGGFLIEMYTIEDVNRLCDEGLLWDVRLYKCKSWSGDLKPTLCYKCWSYGYKAKFCQKNARCGRCAAGAHEGGEENCPTNKGSVPVRCPMCVGPHTVFSKECPEGKKRWDQAKAYYRIRPVRFEI